MKTYQIWRNGEKSADYVTLPEAVEALIGNRTIEDAIRYYDMLDSETTFLLSTGKGKKMDIAELLRTGSEDAASIARLNSIRLRRQKKCYKAYTFRLNKEKDYSLVSFLSSKDNLNEYLRQLIEEDFEKTLYPVLEGEGSVYATPAVRRMMKLLDITPYMLTADSFAKIYPINQYGIIVNKLEGKYYARHIEEPSGIRLEYKPVA